MCVDRDIKQSDVSIVIVHYQCNTFYRFSVDAVVANTNDMHILYKLKARSVCRSIDAVR